MHLVFSFLDNPESIILDSNNKGSVLKSSKKMEAYDSVFDLCNQSGLRVKVYNWPKLLFEYCTNAHYNYLKRQKVKFKLDTVSDEATLYGLVKVYKNHKIVSKLLRAFFLAVEKFADCDIIKKTTESFKTLVLSDDAICQNYCNALLHLINIERDGESYNKTLVQTVIMIFEEHGLYFFQQPLIQGATDYYRDRSVAWFHDNFISEYLKIVENIIINEKNRVLNYLHKNRVDEFIKAIETQLLFIDRKPIQMQLFKCFDTFLENNLVGEIQRMFRLFSSYEIEMKELSRLFREFIVRFGMERLEIASSRSISK